MGEEIEVEIGQGDQRSPLPSSFLIYIRIQKQRGKEIMEQLKGLWRDTWWVWCVFFFISVVLAASTSWVALVVLPCLSVSFCYFAYIRYDENGNEKGNY